MSVSLYMDVSVPFAITDQLRVAAVDVVTAQDDGARRFSDQDLLDRATQLGRILVTQDADLLVEGSLRQRTGRSFEGIIYTPQARVSIGNCVADLGLIAKLTERSEWLNRVEYLPLK